MLSMRRIRELKEKLDCQPVIPDEFRAIADEIMTDPQAPTLVAMLVDSYLAVSTIKKNDGCGSAADGDAQAAGTSTDPADRAPTRQHNGRRPSGGHGRRR